MKTYKNLFPKIYDYENLHGAYLEARKNKRYKNSVLLYSAHLEENLIDLQNSLIWHTYTPKPFYQFVVTRPKKRLIMAPDFSDRVLQWAVFRVMAPLYYRTFINESYGCVPGRGPLKAAQKVERWLHGVSRAPDRDDWYILKADVAKFFFRIPHEVQLRELGKIIADDDVKWLYERILKGPGVAYGAPSIDVDILDCERVDGLGMPVGTIMSQLTANVVMNPVDHYMKRIVGVRHYARYMDDIIIIDRDKRRLQQYRKALSDYLWENLGLQLNQKTVVMPARMGVEFVGYKITSDGIRPRKKTVLQMRRYLRSIQEKYSRGEITMEQANAVFSSALGLLSHGNCQGLRKKVAEDFVLVRHSEDQD